MDTILACTLFFTGFFIGIFLVIFFWQRDARVRAMKNHSVRQQDNEKPLLLLVKGDLEALRNITNGEVDKARQQLIGQVEFGVRMVLLYGGESEYYKQLSTELSAFSHGASRGQPSSE